MEETMSRVHTKAHSCIAGSDIKRFQNPGGFLMDGRRNDLVLKTRWFFNMPVARNNISVIDPNTIPETVVGNPPTPTNCAVTWAVVHDARHPIGRSINRSVSSY